MGIDEHERSPPARTSGVRAARPRSAPARVPARRRRVVAVLTPAGQRLRIGLAQNGQARSTAHLVARTRPCLLWRSPARRHSDQERAGEEARPALGARDRSQYRRHQRPVCRTGCQGHHSPGGVAALLHHARRRQHGEIPGTRRLAEGADGRHRCCLAPAAGRVQAQGLSRPASGPTPPLGLLGQRRWLPGGLAARRHAARHRRQPRRRRLPAKRVGAPDRGRSCRQRLDPRPAPPRQRQPQAQVRPARAPRGVCLVRSRPDLRLRRIGSTCIAHRAGACHASACVRSRGTASCLR